jgi:hypothetical protein
MMNEITRHRLRFSDPQCENGSNSLPLMKAMRSLKIDKRLAEKLLTAKIAKNCRHARKEKLIAC